MTIKTAEDIVDEFQAHKHDERKWSWLSDAIDAALTKAIADERRTCVARADKFCQHFDTLSERFKKQLRSAIRRDDTANTQTEGEGR
jgi:hypothetical protein